MQMDPTSYLIRVFQKIKKANPGIDLGFILGYTARGKRMITLTGKVPGKALNLPQTGWKHSKGKIIGTKLPVYYKLHYRVVFNSAEKVNLQQ